MIHIPKIIITDDNDKDEFKETTIKVDSSGNESDNEDNDELTENIFETRRKLLRPNSVRFDTENINSSSKEFLVLITNKLTQSEIIFNVVL